MIVNQLFELLAEHTGKDMSEITPEATFESLGIDSLDTVELLMNLEEKMGFEFELDRKVSTVGEMIAFLEEKTKA